MREMLRLFDQCDRTDALPARYYEPIFDGLNRLAWKNAERIRNLLDGWFVTYPVHHKMELRGRFRSQRNSDHQGAFFELFIHQLLIELGYIVEVNPLTRLGNTPDFLAEMTSGETFFLDARVVDPKTLKHSLSEELVFDELNKLHCPDFWLTAKVRGVLLSSPPLKKIRETFQAWIDQLNYENVRDNDCSFGKCFSQSFEHESWVLTLKPIAKGGEHRGRPGARPLIPPPKAEFVDSAKPIIQAIREKDRRYRNLGSPLVVAVNALDLSGVDRTDILQALFGWSELTDLPDSARITPPTGIGKKECLWTANKNSSVSAILLFNELQPNSMASAPMCLYENPWASHSIPASLRRVPHGLVEGGFIRWYPGEALNSILGLPQHWPGPK